MTSYEVFYENATPIPTDSLRDMLKLILKENSFQSRAFSLMRGTTSRLTVPPSANIFMSRIETEIISKS